MNMVVIQKPSLLFPLLGPYLMNHWHQYEKYGMRIISIHKHYTSNTKSTQSWGQCKSEITHTSNNLTYKESNYVIITSCK